MTVNNGLTENWNNVDEFAWPSRWIFDGATTGIEPRLQDVEGRFGLAYGLANARKVWTDDYSAEVLGPQAS